MLYVLAGPHHAESTPHIQCAQVVTGYALCCIMQRGSFSYITSPQSAACRLCQHQLHTLEAGTESLALLKCARHSGRPPRTVCLSESYVRLHVSVSANSCWKSSSFCVMAVIVCRPGPVFLLLLVVYSTCYRGTRSILIVSRVLEASANCGAESSGRQDMRFCFQPGCTLVRTEQLVLSDQW